MGLAWVWGWFVTAPRLARRGTLRLCSRTFAVILGQVFYLPGPDPDRSAPPLPRCCRGRRAARGGDAAGAPMGCQKGGAGLGGRRRNGASPGPAPSARARGGAAAGHLSAALRGSGAAEPGGGRRAGGGGAGAGSPAAAGLALRRGAAAAPSIDDAVSRESPGAAAARVGAAAAIPSHPAPGKAYLSHLLPRY